MIKIHTKKYYNLLQFNLTKGKPPEDPPKQPINISAIKVEISTNKENDKKK